MFKDKNIIPVFLVLFVYNILTQLAQIIPIIINSIQNTQHIHYLRTFELVLKIVLIIYCIYIIGYYLSIVKNTTTIIDKVLLNPFSNFVEIFRHGKKLFFAGCLFFIPIGTLSFILYTHNKYAGITLITILAVILIVLQAGIKFNFIKTGKLSVIYRWKAAFEILKLHPKEYFCYCYLPPILYGISAIIIIIPLICIYAVILILSHIDPESLQSELLFNLCFAPMLVYNVYGFLVMSHFDGQFYDRFVKENN